MTRYRLSVVMQWFTREYVRGDLSDEEIERRQLSYADHLQEIGPRLTNEIRELLSINLHDAQIRSWDYEPGQEFTMSLVCGDVPRGYEHVELTYLRPR